MMERYPDPAESLPDPAESYLRCCAPTAIRSYPGVGTCRDFIVKNTSNRAVTAPDRAHELKAELASKVARLIGSSEKLGTAIPRLTLHRRTAPTAGCPVTYEPSVTVIPQGRKQVQIGGEPLTYDSSTYLLTSVDLPTVARVVEASEQEPCLVLNLQLDISIAREFLSQE